jgi:lantibiotic biosynthesis protein
MHSKGSEKTRLEPEIHDSGFFVLRTPLLPFDDFLNWSANLTAPGALDNPEQLALNLAKDRQILRTRLREIILRPDVLEALFIASPDLHQSLEIWQRDPESNRGQRIERALIRYFSRLTGRGTPFGLCAGISIGEIGDQTEFMMADRTHYKRHTRLDMKYLDRLMALLALAPSFKNAHIYRPSTSLYRVADRFHYVEEERGENSRIHRLVAIDSSSLLDAALERSSKGACVADLIQTLTGLDGASPAEAKEYVEELIDNQVLVPDFGPVITGPEPLIDAIEQLEKYAETGRLISRLKEIREQLEAIDKQGLGISAQRYYEVAGELDQLTAPEKVGRHIKVDLVKPVLKMTLGRDLVNQLIRGVKVVQSLAPPQDSELQDFRSRFIDRYGTRELPLVMVLDEELGIGFNFDNLNAPPWRLHLQANGDSRKPGAESDNSAGAPLLLKKVVEAQSKGELEISLNGDDLRLLGNKQSVPLPASFSVKAVIIRHNSTENDYRIEIKSVIGPSGVNYLARFCQAETQLSQLVDGHLRAEERQYSEAVFAEVVHLPEEGIANVLCRPLFHEFEIPYLGRSGAPPERQLALTDLLVSVEGNRIVLRSKRLGKEVVPRLSTAHNFSTNHNLAVYRFLGLLQRQGTARVRGWDWGTLKDLQFLPRVTAGRLILARARWRVTSDELSDPGDGSGADHYLAVQEWRAKRKLPRYVAFTVADGSELLIDFENVLSVETFLELLKKHGEVSLVERFLSDSSELFARGPEGCFAGDIVVPFVNTATQPASPAARLTVAIKERCFPPGSEWLYLKMYCGPATIDRILYSLRPFIEQVLSLGTVDRWFFIRYNDPHPHIRLRFHGDPATLSTSVLPQLQDFAGSLLDAGLVWRVQIDTYDREVERYGGPHGIALAEEIFCADSMFALTIVSNYAGNAGASARWLLTLRSIDQLLSDFGLKTRNKYEFVCKLKSPALPSDLVIRFKRHLGEKYRRERKAIESVMTAPLEDGDQFGSGLLALHQRTNRIVTLAERFQTLQDEGKLTRPLQDIIPSFTHMNINRMLKSDFKEQEFVAYDFLRRFYEWLAAKETGKH